MFMHSLSKTNQLTLIVLFLIISVAFKLRINAIDYGLPFSYHFDEKSYSGGALNLGNGTIGPQINPTGYTNLLFIEYGAYFIIGYLTGLFPTLSSFEQLYRLDPSSFLLIARVTSVFFGTLTVPVIYGLGKNVFNRKVGLLAALFLAITFLHVRDSHYAVPDIMATFLICLTTLFCVFGIQTQKLFYLNIAFFIAGYATTTKWNALLLLVPLAITFAVTVRDLSNHSEIINFRLNLQAITLSGLFLTGFFLGAFQIFIEPRLFFEYFLKELSAASQGSFYYWQVDTAPGWLFYLKTLVFGSGWLLTGLALIGTVYYLIKVLGNPKRNIVIMVVLAFPLLYFLLMGSSYHYFARYTLPLIPYATLFASALVIYLSSLITKPNKSIGYSLTSTITIIIVIPMLISDIRSNHLLAKEDTRTTAKIWIEQNIPESAKIYTDWPVYVPYLSTFEKIAPQSTKEYIVHNSIDGHGLSDHSISWYRDQGYQYLIASSFMYNIPLVDKQKNSIREQFYKELDKECVLLKEIKPCDESREPNFIFDELYGPFISLWQRDVPGPTIKIYSLQGPSSLTSP